MTELSATHRQIFKVTNHGNIVNLHPSFQKMSFYCLCVLKTQGFFFVCVFFFSYPFYLVSSFVSDFVFATLSPKQQPLHGSRNVSLQLIFLTKGLTALIQLH